VLKPSAQQGPVVVFGLPHALGGQETVVQAGGTKPNQTKIERSLKPYGERAWVFWEDAQYGAQFEHPTRLLFVDDRTGHPSRPIPFEWYPLIDAHVPPFLRAGANFDPRYAVFFKSPSATGVMGRAFWLDEVGRARAAAAKDVPPAPLVLPPHAFNHVCILMIGDQGPDPRFRADFVAVADEAKRLGIAPVIEARSTERGRPAGPKDLARFARELALEGCQDMLLFIAGHGYKGAPSGAVNIGEVAHPDGPGKVKTEDIDITGVDVEKLIASLPKVKFKLKVSSCYSGNFTDFLSSVKNLVPNLLVAEASSSAAQPSYFHLSGAVLPDGSVQDNPGSYPEDEFTHHNVTGWEDFATSTAEVTLAMRAGGDLFAHMMVHGFELGKSADFAYVSGKTTPQLFDNAPPPPQLNPIDAAFTQSAFSTVYTENATGQDLRYQWSVSIPIDPGCAEGFHPNSPEAYEATWYHADVSEGGPCNHTGNDYDATGRGHPGTVTLVVSDGTWSCVATYYGTQGDNGAPQGVGSPPQPCQQ
jgi:hypothetical protein